MREALWLLQRPQPRDSRYSAHHAPRDDRRPALLTGRKSHLVRLDLEKEFIAEYIASWNRARAEVAAAHKLRQELDRVSGTLGEGDFSVAQPPAFRSAVAHTP